MKSLSIIAGILGAFMTAACTVPPSPSQEIKARAELPAADPKGCIAVNGKLYHWSGQNIDRDYKDGDGPFAEALRQKINDGRFALGEALSKDSLESKLNPSKKPLQRDYLLHAQTAGLYKRGCNP